MTRAQQRFIRWKMRCLAHEAALRFDRPDLDNQRRA